MCRELQGDVEAEHQQHAKIYRDGILQRLAEVHFNASDGWCAGTDTELRWNHYSVMSAFVKDLDRELAAALATANSDEARIDARARYVLEGGPHAFVEIELARLLGRPSWWRGFFWNNSIATKPPPPISPQVICKNVVEVLDIEMRADSNQASGNYSAALAGYVSCKSTLPKKAYLSACRARNHNRARELYVILNQPSLAQICMKEGFDPRPNVTPTPAPSP